MRLLEHIPRGIAVVANKSLPEWEVALGLLGVQFMAVSIFQASDGVRAYGLDGVLDVEVQSLGFGKYSSIDRAIRLALAVPLPEGDVQIDDPDGALSTWSVVRSGTNTWVRKVLGVPDFENEQLIQLLRTARGRISLRRC
jgi:hypothetical protein